MEGFPDLRNQQKFPEDTNGHRASCSCCVQVFPAEWEECRAVKRKEALSQSVSVSSCVSLSPNIPIYFQAVQRMSPKSQTIKGSVHAKYNLPLSHCSIEAHRKLQVWINNVPVTPHIKVPGYSNCSVQSFLGCCCCFLPSKPTFRLTSCSHEKVNRVWTFHSTSATSWMSRGEIVWKCGLLSSYWYDHLSRVSLLSLCLEVWLIRTDRNTYLGLYCQHFLFYYHQHQMSVHYFRLRSCWVFFIILKIGRELKTSGNKCLHGSILWHSGELTLNNAKCAAHQVARVNSLLWKWMW